jgi:hypothetical protein
VGRLWLATDRGLLEAPGLAGPWRRAAPPAGTSSVRAIAAGAGIIYLATDAGLMSGRAETAQPAGRTEAPPSPFEVMGEPGIGRVHRAAPPAGRTEAPAPPFEAPADPGIRRVHRAAIAYLDLRRGRLEQMRRRVNRRGWLPIVTLRGEHDSGEGRSTDHDQAFLSGDVRYLTDRDSDRSRDWGVALTLTWDFGDLAYHPEEVDVSRETRELMELRDDVLDEITQLYFERRRVLAELSGLSDAAARARLRLRAEELAAGIDAWTGGWFSRNAALPEP